MKTIVHFLPLLLMSCVTAPTDSSELSETRYQPRRGGVVKYWDGASEAFSRGKALEKITSVCPTGHELVSEKKATFINGYAPVYGTLVPITRNITNIEFDCK